jgi:hypothetical protein
VDATGGIELRRRWDGEGEGEQRGGRRERREEEGLTGAGRGGRREHGGGRKEGALVVGEVHGGQGEQPLSPTARRREGEGSGLVGKLEGPSKRERSMWPMKPRQFQAKIQMEQKIPLDKI